MKKLLLLLVATMVCVPMLQAETFTAGGETYTYTVNELRKMSSGVTYQRLRFTSPVTINVNLVTADLSDEDVRVEAFLGQDKLLKTEKMTTGFTRRKNAGRNPVACQNAHFWSMSSQTGTDAGVYATNTCLGGAMVNGEIVTETNSYMDQYNGGPADNGNVFHGVMGITKEGKAYIGNYQTLAKVVCTTRGINYLTASEVNKYCHAQEVLAMFTPLYPSDRAIKIIDSSAGQAGTDVTGSVESTELYLTLKSGETIGYNKEIKTTVAKKGSKEASITRGTYDFVLVAAPGTNKTWLDKIQVGDEVVLQYNWYDCTNAANVPNFENLIAGNAIVMKNGAITSRATNEYYNSQVYSRSAYGVSADNTKLIMCVIDNKAHATYGSSSGCNTTRMSYIMKHFGADDVLNCDAGGSAQMVVGGSLVNSPSDGSERAVASGIMVYSNSGNIDGGSDLEIDTYEEVTPEQGTANPFAFEVTGSVDLEKNELTVNYVLNTAATGVSVVIKKDGVEVKRVALGSEYLTEAAHSATVDINNFDIGTYTWGIEVTGAKKSAVQYFKTLGFNHPQGVDVDCNMESPYFGRIYVTEGRATTASKHYSGTNGGQGLYVFTPRFVGFINYITGKYAYTGGVTFDQTVGTKSGADFRKVRVSEDGRVFVTRQNDGGNYLYEMPDFAKVQQKNAAFTSVFTGGALNASTYAYENGSAFISAPNIGFDVKGSGEDLTFAMLSGQAAVFSSSAPGTSRADEYQIGNATTWNKVPQSITALTGKYTVNYSGTNICYDNRGGIWYCQYRGTPKDSEPALVYVDSTGKELYKDVTTPRGGGGIRFNRDFTQMAIASSASTISIYNISYKSDGIPILDEQIRITHGMGTNINDLAWDLANNLYAVSNNNELLKAFSIPRADNVFTTEAASQYTFIISIPTAIENVNTDADEPVEYYNLQGVKVVNPSKGVFVKKQGNNTTKVVL